VNNPVVRLSGHIEGQPQQKVALQVSAAFVTFRCLDDYNQPRTYKWPLAPEDRPLYEQRHDSSGQPYERVAWIGQYLRWAGACEEVQIDVYRQEYATIFVWGRCRPTERHASSMDVVFRVVTLDAKSAEAWQRFVAQVVGTQAGATLL
jgi:hypothetical protein